jgi:hypothetical protein
VFSFWYKSPEAASMKAGHTQHIPPVCYTKGLDKKRLLLKSSRSRSLKLKKKLLLAAALLAMLFAALLLGACKSTAKSKTEAASETGATTVPAGITDPSMPPWINDMPPDGELWGIGYADSVLMNLRMTMADSRARQDLARQIETLARGMVVDYSRQGGGIADTTVLQFQEAVSRQIAEAKLTGAVTNQRWDTSDHKALWVRVKIGKDDAAASIQKAIDSEAACYAEFKAMEALKMMDQQLEKNRPLPLPVTE